MSSASIDRRLGLSGNTAVKTPVTVVATSNITLSGEQTIDGVAVKAINAAGVPDRVLCTGQTTTSQNGIWDVNTGSWTRARDANGNYDLVNGSQVVVAQGSAAKQVWILTTADPITIGTTGQTWSQNLSSGFLATLAASGGSSLVGFIQAGTGAVARTAQSKMREWVSVLDFGAVGDGTTDDTTAINNALTAGSIVLFPAGTYVVSSLTVPSDRVLCGFGSASVLKQKNSTAQFNSVISISSKSNVTVKDLTINGNGNSVAVGEHNHGVQISDSTDCAVLNVTVHDCNGDAIYISSTTNSILCKRISVVGCTVYNLGRQGICVAEYGARNILIKGNHGRVGTYVTTSTSNGNPIHLELDTQPSVYVGDVVIEGNVLNDMGISIGGNFSNVSIIGNTVRGGAFTGTFGLIGLVNVFDASISGNTLIGDNTTVIDGIYLQDSGAAAAAAVKNVTINGNTIEKVAGHGIEMLGTAPGIPSIGRVTISGNIIDTIGTGSSKCGITVNTPFPDLQVYGNTIKTVTNIGISILGSTNFTVAGNRVAEWSGSYAVYFATNSAVGAGPGIVTGNTVSHTVPAGKTAIRVENEATNTRISIFDNDLAGVATPVNIGAAAVKCSAWGNIAGNDAPNGSFTLGAAATTVVTNANVTTTSRIILTPTNAAAATLMGSAKALYVSARTAQTSFTVATASAAAAAGTETFDYAIY